MQKSSGNTITAFPTMQACLYCIQRVEHRQALKIKKRMTSIRHFFVRVTNANIFWKYKCGCTRVKSGPKTGEKSWYDKENS